MSNEQSRRSFIKKAAFLSMVTVSAAGLAPASASARSEIRRTGSFRLKTSLNAFSFNGPLTAGKDGKPAAMNLLDLLEFCARENFDGLDPTGYYFPGYPEVPTDEFINHFKKRAFELGIDITGTGVRNNFASADREARLEDRKRVEAWIVAAAKLGAPVIRVFAGHEAPGADREEVARWMADDLRACADIGQRYGVVVGVQNHGDFLQTGDQTVDMVRRVGHDWLGVILDTGNFPGDPYGDIAKVLPYTVNFQVKESPYGKDSPVRLDLDRFVKIVTDAGYRGYLPIETLPPARGTYDPFVVVPRFHAEVVAAFARAG